MKKAIAVLACFFVLAGCGEKKSKDDAQTNAVSSIRDTEIQKGNYQQNTKPKSPLDFVGHPNYNVCTAYAGVAKSASVQWFESRYSYDEIIATARSMKNFSPNNPKYALNALSWEQTVQIINKAISDTPYSQDLRKKTMNDIFFSCMDGKEDVPGRPDLKKHEVQPVTVKNAAHVPKPDIQKERIEKECNCGVTVMFYSYICSANGQMKEDCLSKFNNEPAAEICEGVMSDADKSKLIERVYTDKQFRELAKKGTGELSEICIKNRMND